MMPRRDGLALLAGLRADERTARVPVLLLSARAGEEEAVQGLAAQADDYLVKPFTAPELLARVDAHLQLGRARRRAEVRFTAMADLAPAMIWVADPDGGRTFHNAGWRRFTGRDPAQDLGEGWRDGLHPDDREQYRAVTAEATAAGLGWEVEYRLRRADGVYHRVVEQAVALPGEDGPSGWVGSCIDVNVRALEADRQRLLARIGAELDGETEVVDRLELLVRLLVEVRLAARASARPVDDEGQPGAARVAVRTEAPLRLPRGRAAVGRLGGRRGAGRAGAPRGGRGGRCAAPPADGPRPGRGDPVPRALAGGAGLDRRGPRPRRGDRRPRRPRAGQRPAARRGARGRRAPVVAAAGHQRALGRGDPDRGGRRDRRAPPRALRGLGARRGLRVRARRAHADPARGPQRRPGRGHRRPGAGDDGRHRGAPRARRCGWSAAPATPRPTTTTPPSTPSCAARGCAGRWPCPSWRRAPRSARSASACPTARACSRTERITLEALAEPCAMALDRARLYRAEHQIADTLQRSLLPQGLPELDRLGLAARYLPGATGTQAGGDWYDVVELDEHRVAIAVGDVVGQGTGAAAVMGQLRTALSGYLLAGHGPARALGLLDGLTSRIPGSRASTAMCLTLDTSTGELRWARAGHLPALLVGADGAAVRYLDDPAGHGPLLGLPPGHRDHGEAVTHPRPGRGPRALHRRPGRAARRGPRRGVRPARRGRRAAPGGRPGADGERAAARPRLPLGRRRPRRRPAGAAAPGAGPPGAARLAGAPAPPGHPVVAGGGAARDHLRGPPARAGRGRDERRGARVPRRRRVRPGRRPAGPPRRRRRRGRRPRPGHLAPGAARPRVPRARAEDRPGAHRGRAGDAAARRRHRGRFRMVGAGPEEPPEVRTAGRGGATTPPTSSPRRRAPPRPSPSRTTGTVRRPRADRRHRPRRRGRLPRGDARARRGPARRWCWTCAPSGTSRAPASGLVLEALQAARAGAARDGRADAAGEPAGAGARAGDARRRPDGGPLRPLRPSPASRARTIASARSATCSLVKIADTTLRTVFGDR